MLIRAATLSLLALASGSVRAPAQESAWIYDIFVKECQKSGGTPRSTLQQYMRGEKFNCETGGSSGRSTARGGNACERESKISIDWVFNDRGALATYNRNRQQGKSAFDAVVAAQGHNPRAQRSLRDCKQWAQTYLAQRGAAPGGLTMPTRALGQTDCACISVVPAGPAGLYRVTNRCDAMEITVGFGGDIARLSPSPNAIAAPASAGVVTQGKPGMARAPGHFTIVSINSVGLKNAGSSFVCRF